MGNALIQGFEDKIRGSKEFDVNSPIIWFDGKSFDQGFEENPLLEAL